MDEDLKIIVTSELEADEQASAQRISAQLPDIAKLINQKSKIKVQVEVDNSNIQTEAQKFSKEMSRAAQTHKVGVSVGLDRDSVKKMQAELNSLKVNPDVSHAMTAQLEKMGIQIDRISGRWEQVNDQEERMLSLSIQGTDQLGRSVSYLQTYDAVTGDINTHLTNVTMNLEKQRQVEAQLAAKAKADNESRISYLTKQKAVLSDIQASYTGATSAKPVHDTTHLDALNSKYSELEAKIQSMIGTSGRLDKVQRASIEAEIASLKQLVKEYQNAEYVATKLRTKDIGSIKTDQFAALDTLENRLQSAGILTDEFKNRIDGLRTQLNEAFDPASLTAFLNSFDKLEGDITTFKEQLRGVNAIYTQIISVENKITRTKSAMVGLDPEADKEKLAALNDQLALYEQQRQALNNQLAPYSEIIQYARQAEAAERARLENEAKLKLSEAELADKVREIEQIMQRIPSTVKDLEVRFGQLVTPTDNLIQKMQMLREAEAAYSSAGTDAEKIAAYERLQFLIGEVTMNLEKQRRTEAQIAARDKADNESRISYLTKQKAVLSDIQASYTGATSAKPVHDTTHLDALNAKYSELEAKIESMISASGRLDKVQRANIEAEIASLKQLVKEYQNAEYVATKLRTKDIGSIKTDQFAALDTLEKRLQSAGTLTEEFKGRISGLRGQLESAFDPATLTAFLNSFDKLEGDIATFQEQLRGVNAIYTQIIGVENKMTRTKSAMVGLDPTADKEKLAALNEQLALYRSQKQELESQLAPYSAIIQYARQAEAAERTRLENEAKLKLSEAQLADKAREIEQTMQRIPSTVKDLEVRFGQLVAPTDNLIYKMRMLRESEAAYHSAKTDTEKIAAYERLHFLIGECSKEISELNRVQRGDVLSFKFDENLMKAKADLETIGRQWSALKKDPGLNAQFRMLIQNLREVNNQADLTKWTSQFSRFKSEVKAAGKNMQSLGDVLKNNVGKVLQWVSATTLLFRAFSLLKKAISTVVALDTAMIDLRKTTNATEAEYRKFYYTANETAKALGVTTEEVISQTAEWSRLGYTLEEAAKLAENSAIFKAISPEMDASMATDGLISVIKAFDIDVDDTMDGIISKVNAVGNSFAVSNADIVEALTRSSSAMAAANNTFDETVALATSAIEITRDAASVGNGLKTLSMRIRGYDEETEEYIGGVEELTGVIADLTKTASNPSGISLFEDGDPDTYRSTYDILSDISKIWDEITDKDQAQLLEALFGKRQAQIGAAMLSNFEQADSAIKTMENSYLSAEKEMEKIYQSLDYKLNKLSETWVGVSQNLFDTDQMKLVVDFLTILSNGVAGLTGYLGLFGTTALVVFGVQFIKSLSNAKNAMNSAKIAIAGLRFDPDNLNEYVYALSGLKKKQQEVVLSTTNLSNEQQAAILKEVAAIREKTMVQVASILGTSEEVAMNRLNITSIEELTMEKLKAALASKQITQAEYEQIIASGLLNTKNMTLSMSFETLKANALAAFAAMATNPMTWIMGAVAFISLLVNWWQKAKQAAEDARQSMSEAAEAANEQRNSLGDLVAEYKELATAGDFDSSARETAKRIQEDITKLVGQQAENLDLVNGKLDEQIKKLHDIRYQDAKDAAGALETKYLDAQQQYDAGVEARDTDTNFMGVVTHAGSYDQIIKKLGNFGEEWKNVNDVFSISYALSNKNAEEVLAMYKELQTKMLDSDDWQAMADDPWTGWIGVSAQDLLNDVQDKIDLYQGIVDEYNSASQNYLENQAIIDVFDDLKTTTIDSQASFDAYIKNIQNSSEFSEQYKKILIEAANGVFPQYNQAVSAASDGAEIYAAKLATVSDVLSKLRSSYSVLESAKEDMADGGGLSAETIEALADAEENYLEYLYEENGLIKLNTDAWKENANAKMQNEMGEIQKEIDSLVARNAELQESIAYYEEQRRVSSDGGAWDNLISQSTAELSANNEVIAENQKLLSLYSVLYSDITGELDAYTSALHNFANVANSIDSISSSFQTLADLQAAVADGFTMSLEKALEFAAVYPEILNNAQVSSDGQIALNEGVVNTFIQGKKAELDTQIDAQIAQLEADKAVLEAKMQAAQAQLDLAKNVGEGEGQISKELAEYRINAGNIVAQAMIDAGIDEATAFKLAAAAMAQNAEEFDRVAMEVCTDVNGNFNKAAYAAAQAVYNNMTRAKTDVASFAKQCQEAARAMAGVAGGNVAGSTGVIGGSGGGVGGSGISLNLTSGNFLGTDYNYTSNQTNLDDFISQIELDISSYQDAISQISGQIAALQALKNLPLNSFSAGGGSGGGGSGGGGSGGGSSAKEIEEYIATIDDYREAIERLRKVQEARANIEDKIDRSDNLKEKILLEKQLIGAYEREQEALHNLNNQRDTTITAGVNALRKLGFAVQYNADTNDLWIDNMEHLNKLTADNCGEYDTLQEATNALRKETEDLINSLTDLNEENRAGSENWWELKYSIDDAHESILQFLKDIVDGASDAIESIQNAYDILHEMADEYNASGFITIDTLQKLTDAGINNVAFLKDENGQLLINEERIQAVIAARTQQLAIESSLAYVEAIRMAKAEGDISTLNSLLYATEQATDATWGFVYANLALAGLDEDQYQAALQNINAIRAMADSAVQSIGKVSGGVTEELEEMQDGLNDTLDHVMDMLKQRIQEQIDGLEDMKDAYSEVIDLKKESLQASKDEADHQKTMASKMREIAKLQARIDALSLDDSREAQAEKAALLEEMAELQDDLADEQANRTLEAQEDALDKMEEAYHEEKDKEIEILEDSISSYQKLYDMAISYIESHWDTLYGELIAWNTQYGDVLNSEITSAWDNCLAAAQRYGSYVSALESIEGDVQDSQSSGANLQVGNTNYDSTSSNEDMIHSIVKEMYANSRQHASEDTAGQLYLNRRNIELGSQLAQYGVTAVRGNNGVWYVNRVGGELLYEKYKRYIYHNGGIVGGGDTKSNEQISLLKTKEWVLSEQMVDNLTTQMARINQLSDAMNDLPSYAGNTTLADVMKQVGGSKTVNNVTNNSRPIELQIGDTIIHGADQSTVEKHIRVTRDMVNQIGRIIGIGR